MTTQPARRILRVMNMSTQAVILTSLLLLGCAQADYIGIVGGDKDPNPDSTPNPSDDSDETNLPDTGPKDTDDDDSQPRDTEQTTDTPPPKDTGKGGDTGAPVDTGSPDTGDPPDTGTGEEPDTEFKCLNDLQCTLKWFGTICCDNRCINPLVNAQHCNSCQNDCTADKRGNNCVMGSCVCGPIPGVVCLGEPDQCCRIVPFINIFACEPC